MQIAMIGILVVFGAAFLIYNNSQSKNTAVKKENISGGKVKKNENPAPKVDMFKFMEFDKILDDMIIQNNGTKYTMVVQCKGINYELMSEIEQLAVEEGFITFLNTLKSPIQLYVQARTINLKKSIDMYKEKIDVLGDKLDKANIKIKNLNNDINATKGEIMEASVEKDKVKRIFDYAEDISKYVERLSSNKNMLQRKFYVIVSMNKADLSFSDDFTAEEIYENIYNELYTRAEAIVSGLHTCSVSGRVLNSNELAELMYVSINRDDAKLIDIKTALDSGFYRLYSVSEDVQEKKRKAIRGIIEAEAVRRVEKAIEIAIKNGIIQSEEQTLEEMDNAADLAAVKIVENLKGSKEDKNKVKKVIVDAHNEKAEERKKEKEKKEKENKKNETQKELSTVENEDDESIV